MASRQFLAHRGEVGTGNAAHWLTKTRNLEDRIALVNTENKEKLDAKIAEARADVEAKKNAFKAKTEAIKSDADSSVAAVKNSFKETFAQRHK